MANTETTTTEDAQPKAPAVPITTMAVLAPGLGWLIPGGGHLIQKRWVRGFVLMFCIGTMFALGGAIGGKIYQPHTGDLLDILGVVGDGRAGALYILWRLLRLGSP